MKELPALKSLVDQLRRLPYLSCKNVYKVATHLLSLPEHDLQRLLFAIDRARGELVKCQQCANWVQSADLCVICSDTTRSAQQVCVVESWHDLCAIERSGEFKGMFHVLGGSISPLEGIGPEQLNIQTLVSRVKSGVVSELILATNLTPEGEATSAFISSCVAPFEIKITRLASGIPMGSTLEFMDKLTISKALEGRLPF